MKYKIIAILLFSFIVGGAEQGFAQNIQLSNSSINRAEYFYGEQFRVYFDVLNKSIDQEDYRFKPVVGDNLEITLYSIDSKETKKPYIVKGMKHKVLINSTNQSELPLMYNDQINKGSSRTYEIGLVSYFGKKYETENNHYGIKVIPPGKYKLVLNYLSPEGQVESNVLEIPFEIKNTSGNEKKAFEDMVDAFDYLMQTGYEFKTNPYNGKNQRSVEQFLNKNRNSIFYGYAFDEFYKNFFYRNDIGSENLKNVTDANLVKSDKKDIQMLNLEVFFKHLILSSKDNDSEIVSSCSKSYKYLKSRVYGTEYVFEKILNTFIPNRLLGQFEK